jgi:hypothetical protein
MAKVHFSSNRFLPSSDRLQAKWLCANRLAPASLPEIPAPRRVLFVRAATACAIDQDQIADLILGKEPGAIALTGETEKALVFGVEPPEGFDPYPPERLAVAGSDLVYDPS